MRVECNPCPVGGLRLRAWGILALALVFSAGCSSHGDKRAESAGATKQAVSSDEETTDVLAAFDAWANDGETQAAQPNGTQGPAAAGTAGSPSSGDSAGSGDLDGVLERFNHKVRTCWKQPFGMPRLATVRLLVQFNPDGTVRNVAPHPEASEAVRYRTETPYLVMIAQTSQALRKCQPYQSIRQNFAKLSRLEMVVDPRMFRN